MGFAGSVVKTGIITIIMIVVEQKTINGKRFATILLLPDVLTDDAFK